MGNQKRKDRNGSRSEKGVKCKQKCKRKCKPFPKLNFIELASLYTFIYGFYSNRYTEREKEKDEKKGKNNTAWRRTIISESVKCKLATKRCKLATKSAKQKGVK